MTTASPTSEPAKRYRERASTVVPPSCSGQTRVGWLGLAARRVCVAALLSSGACCAHGEREGDDRLATPASTTNPATPQPDPSLPVPTPPTSAATPPPSAANGPFHQPVVLVIRGRVLRSDTVPAYCGYFHFVAAREYQVLEVLEGTWAEPTLLALASCPEPGEAGRPSGEFVLELARDPVPGIVHDTMGDPARHRFYIVRATPD